jgi:hypothetical protein
MLDINGVIGSNSSSVRRIFMKKSLSFFVGAALLATGLSLPSPSIAQEASAPGQRRPGFFSILGSILLTPPHLVYKAATCATAQSAAAIPYVMTFGVEGAYEGGTNGRDIGETARRSCTGAWVVRPSHIVRDYGE